MAKPKRRSVRFNTLGEAFQDIEMLVAADKAAALVHTGNWDLGKTLGHLATWCEFAYDGYPEVTRVPLPKRLILRGLRNTILNKGMVTGVKVGKVPGGTLGLDPLSTDDGLRRLRAAFDRLAEERPSVTNPIFGKLKQEQWIALQLRHTELHVSFHHPPAADAGPK